MTPDPEKERQRLAQLYADMPIGELEKIAAEAHSLTEVAQETLHMEIARRNQAGAKIEEQAAATPISHQPEQRDLVLVRRFRDLPEALLAKGVLDSAGIECFLADANMVRTDWFISNLLGGPSFLWTGKTRKQPSKFWTSPFPKHSK
jgi:hypothetical protein